MTKPSLTDMPGHLVRRLNQLSTAVFQQHLKTAGYDLTSVQFSALTALDAHAGLDQTTLAGLIAYDRATIGGVVKRLEQKHLIQRSPSKTDRRAFTLALSPIGKALLIKVTPVVAALQADILSNLSDREQTDLIALMQKALHLDPSP